MVSVSENCSRPRLPPPKKPPPPPASADRPPPRSPPPPPGARRHLGWRPRLRVPPAVAAPLGRRAGGAACPAAGLPGSCRVRRPPNCARIWSITDCDGRFDFSGFEKSKPMRSVSRSRAVEIDRPQVDADQLAGVDRATKRSGNAASIAGVDRDVRDRTIDRLVDIIGAQAQVGLLERLPVGAELQDVAPVGLQVRIAAGDRRRRAPSGRW